MRGRHRLDPSVEVIVFDPCIEAPLCEALGLRGCRVRPCGNGPIRSLDEYLRRRSERGYAKRLLPILFQEASDALLSTREFGRLVEWLRCG